MTSKDNKKEVKDKDPSSDTSMKDFFKLTFFILGIFYKSSKFHTISVVINRVIADLSFLFESYLIARLVDVTIQTLSQGGPVEELYPRLTLLILAFTISNMSGRLGRYSQHILELRIKREIQTLVYSKAYELGTQSMENPIVRALLQSTKKAMFSLPSFLGQIIRAAGTVIQIIATGILLATISPFILLAMLLGMLPLTAIIRKSRRMGWETYKKHQDSLSKSWSIAEYLNNPAMLNEIKIVGAFEFFHQRFIQAQEAFLKEQITRTTTRNLWETLFDVITHLIGLWGYILIYGNVISGAITIGIAGFQTATMWKFRNAIWGFTYSFSNLLENSKSYKEMYEFFNLQPETISGDLKIPHFTSPPPIHIKGVSFTYPNTSRVVLKDISINIKPGEKIAIVGPNGAGKTTLIKLLARIYNIDQGTIFVDKQNIMDININDWYKNLGVLFQDFNFYEHISVGENIVMSRTHQGIDDDARNLASKMADAYDFISKYDDGFETLMSERFKGGIKPSSGQKQKIAIARFFYRNAPVVIFDEPTAAIDAVAEYNIFNKIYDFFANKTVIIISHRFSTVRNADRIVVMDEGRIVEEGSHEELVDMGGKYAEAFKLQAEGYQVNNSRNGKKK